LIRGLGSPVCAVGLVAPRTDVFDVSVRFVLVVVTAVEALLFALTFEVRRPRVVSSRRHLRERARQCN
jgi:hypothetical protein